MKILANKEREDIFKLFTTNTALQFNEIEKATNIPSNKLAYHIDELVKQCVTLEGQIEKLTAENEKLTAEKTLSKTIVKEIKPELK